ncbi:MAG TPA: NPCBM/NEW2 domain-containing protein, partial [Phycisphaerae bacterium]|nr:NPCBM/NEW2 domain-containing protein [Phycisphaerae bacterium]
EGIQEAEARIFLEQALDRKLLPEDLAAGVQKVVDRHCHETLYVPGGSASVYLMDYAGDWQARSRRLYQAAARVAEKIGMDVDRTAFGEASLQVWHGQTFREEVSVPALGRARLSLKLRSWSAKPRAWRAASGDPWIIPEKTEGTVTGHEELRIILDGKALKDGSSISGIVTVTDAAAGTVYPVKIAAKVEKAIEFRVRQELQFVTGGGSGAEQPKLIRVLLEPVLNVPVGGSDSKEYLLVSRAAEKQPWRIESGCDWLVVGPASGEIAPGSSIRVKVTARPKDRAGAIHEPTLTLTAAGGAVKEEHRIRTYVIPPYQAPAVPAGDVVYLNDLDQTKSMKRHVEAGFTKGTKRPRPWHISENPTPNYLRREDPPTTASTPYTMGDKTFSRGLWASPYHETVYNIEGAGFAAFAAEAGFYDKLPKRSYANLGAVVSFEVYVDGKLRTQSGLMRFGDAPRLLVADNLEGAKEVRLVTRRDDLVNDWYCLATWGDPRFYKRR